MADRGGSLGRALSDLSSGGVHVSDHGPVSLLERLEELVAVTEEQDHKLRVAGELGAALLAEKRDLAARNDDLRCENDGLRERVQALEAMKEELSRGRHAAQAEARSLRAALQRTRQLLEDVQEASGRSENERKDLAARIRRLEQSSASASAAHTSSVQEADALAERLQLAAASSAEAREHARILETAYQSSRAALQEEQRLRGEADRQREQEAQARAELEAKLSGLLSRLGAQLEEADDLQAQVRVRDEALAAAQRAASEAASRAEEYAAYFTEAQAVIMQAQCEELEAEEVEEAEEDGGADDEVERGSVSQPESEGALAEGEEEGAGVAVAAGDGQTAGGHGKYATGQKGMSLAAALREAAESGRKEVDAGRSAAGAGTGSGSGIGGAGADAAWDVGAATVTPAPPAVVPPSPLATAPPAAPTPASPAPLPPSPIQRRLAFLAAVREADNPRAFLSASRRMLALGAGSGGAEGGGGSPPRRRVRSLEGDPLQRIRGRSARGGSVRGSVRRMWAGSGGGDEAEAEAGGEAGGMAGGAVRGARLGARGRWVDADVWAISAEKGEKPPAVAQQLRGEDDDEGAGAPRGEVAVTGSPASEMGARKGPGPASGPRIASPARPRAPSSRRGSHVCLLFFHFQMTSLWVKESLMRLNFDPEALNTLDTDHYYQRAIAEGVDVHRWPDWIRQELTREYFRALQLQEASAAAAAAVARPPATGGRCEDDVERQRRPRSKWSSWIPSRLRLWPARSRKGRVLGSEAAAETCVSQAAEVGADRTEEDECDDGRGEPKTGPLEAAGEEL